MARKFYGNLSNRIEEDKMFCDEIKWDLTFKTYEQLVDAYKLQDSIPMDAVIEAIENTNVMADMVEEFAIDRSPKYPRLYDNSEAVFKQKINAGVKWELG